MTAGDVENSETRGITKKIASQAIPGSNNQYGVERLVGRPVPGLTGPGVSTIWVSARYVSTALADAGTCMDQPSNRRGRGEARLCIGGRVVPDLQEIAVDAGVQILAAVESEGVRWAPTTG